MKKMKIASVLGGIALLGSGHAMAEISWNFGGPTNESSTVGNSLTKNSNLGAANAGNVTVTATAWSNTNNGTSGTSNAARGSNSLTGSANYALQTAYLNVYSGGLGVKNQDASGNTLYGDYNDGASPEHSMDNNQRYDSVLFNFSNAVDLNSVTIGWSQTDSDVSVLAYTGTGACVGSGTCTSNASGIKYADLVNYGWSLIGQYANLAVNTAKSINAGNVASSFWLIGAANSLVGGTTDGNTDYVKLLALAGDKYTPTCTPGTPGCGGGGNGVPEPGTLLLLGAGLLGLSRVRRGTGALSAA